MEDWTTWRNERGVASGRSPPAAFAAGVDEIARSHRLRDAGLLEHHQKDLSDPRLSALGASA
jgi:hypothetical protein